MVTGNLAKKILGQVTEFKKDCTFLPNKPKHTSVSLIDIVNNNYRFEASAFSLDAKIATEKIKGSKYNYVYLWSKNGFIENSYYGGRAKRNYVPKNTKGAVGFIGSAEMLEVNPKPIKFLTSLNMNIEPFRVKKNIILISRSGTIGNVSLVSETLSKLLISEHSIRIEAKEFAGYVYAYLKTDIGKTIVKSNTFGAVVDQIEPQHFEKVIIPNPPEEIKRNVHELVVKSYELRDKSNELMDKAEKILYTELQLPPIEELQPKYFDNTIEIRNYQTKLSDLNLRFDGSYHLPIVKLIERAISKNSKEIKLLGPTDLTDDIILPGRFSRTYVEKRNGVQFLGGRDLFQLNPTTEKFLSKSVHKRQIESELKISKNNILTPSRGSIGRVVLAPKHFEKKVISDNIINVRPRNNDVAGYLYCFLNSDYGNILIKRQIYGAVVDAMESEMMAKVEIPLLKNNSKQKEINDLVLKANELRYEAHLKEQEAIRVVNEDVINVTVSSKNLAAEPTVKYKKSEKK